MKCLSTLLLPLSLFPGFAAHAHPKILRLVGTVEHLSEGILTVKTNQGRLRIVVLNDETMFMRGDMPSSSRNLKVGERVILRVYRRRNQLIVAEIVIENVAKSSNEFLIDYSRAGIAHWAKAIGSAH